MYGQICLTGEQRIFNFLDEQALAPDFGQRHVKNDVPPGLQNKQFNVQAKMPFLQPSFDMIGLP